MDFFTHIKIDPFQQKICHAKQIFSIGSCFAENIAQRMCRAKFHITSSPMGTLFNPASIASSIDILANKHTIADEELQYANELWFSYDFHSSFSSIDKEKTQKSMQQSIDQGAKALANAEVVIVTFGTAWIYRLKSNNKVVANCHKQPQALFNRELLTIEEIIANWGKLLNSTLKDKQVIFTISPIRHLSDGLEQNSLSKSILRVAIAELVAKHNNALYFPSFEIMNDELRDYRFYADDMTHPSPLAIDYIWQRFAQTAISEESQRLMDRIAKISQAASHRPFNPQSDAYHNFCQKQLEEIEKINQTYPAIDFSEEKAIFIAHL